jgi:hypothetical protein
MGILICLSFSKTQLISFCQEKEILVWPWFQFSRILLPQLRIKTQGDEEKSGVKGRLRKLVQTLIQASLQDALLNMYKG